MSSDPDSAEQERTEEKKAARRWPMPVAITAWYLVIVSVGLLVGVASGQDAAVQEQLSDPTGRISWRLSGNEVPASRPSLEADIQSLAPTLGPVRTSVLRLIVHLKGNETGGEPNFDRAREIFRSLGWARCDRTALQRMRREVQ